MRHRQQLLSQGRTIANTTAIGQLNGVQKKENQRLRTGWLSCGVGKRREIIWWPRFSQNFFRQTSALATTAGDTQLLAQLLDAGSPFADAAFDIAVSNAVAETNVH